MAHSAPESEVISLLRIAGWHPGRCVADAVASWNADLAAEGFVLHSAAEKVLLEFGGLSIGVTAPGLERARSSLVLNPDLASGERDRLQEYFEELQGRGVYPLGEADGGQSFLAIAKDGEVFLVMDAVYDRWPSFDAALRGLLLGVRSRVN